jgi:hypothetical protein
MHIHVDSQEEPPWSPIITWGHSADSCNIPEQSLNKTDPVTNALFIHVEYP